MASEVINTAATAILRACTQLDDTIVDVEMTDQSLTADFRFSVINPFLEGWRSMGWTAEQREDRPVDYVDRITCAAMLASSQEPVAKLICLPSGATDEMKSLRTRIVMEWGAICKARDWGRLVQSMSAPEREERKVPKETPAKSKPIIEKSATDEPSRKKAKPEAVNHLAAKITKEPKR